MTRLETSPSSQRFDLLNFYAMALILPLRDALHRRDLSLTSAAAFRESDTRFADGTPLKSKAILQSRWYTILLQGLRGNILV